jgi:hypothetical protein
VTGVGDHGPEGIQDFIDKHSCSVTCRALSLASMDSLAIALEERVAEVEAEEEKMGEPSGITIHKDCSPPPTEVADKDNTELEEQ